MSESLARPIIVIKKKSGHGGHHGGAWKVAYADFVTAMMSLFIVLWLLNSTPQVKKAIAGYFNDPRGTSKKMGTEMLGSGPSVTIDKTNVEKLAESIKKAIVQQKELQKLSDQVELRMTDEGLRIELIDGKDGTFFESGSPRLTDNGLKLLGLIAGQLKTLPNRLLIEGHTDAKPFGDGKAGYTNWELSSDRANSARHLIQGEGIEDARVSQVRGYADQALRVPDDPLSPANRRISIVVKFLEAPAGTVGPEILDKGDDDEKSGQKGSGAGKESSLVKADNSAISTEPAAGDASKGGVSPAAKPSGAAVPAPGLAKPESTETRALTGKIDLPPVPTGTAKPSAAQPAGVLPGKPGADFGGQLKQMREMKHADASHGK